MADDQVNTLPRTGYKRGHWGGGEDLESSTQLLVRPGVELENTDFRLGTIPVYNVAGTVSGWEGNSQFIVRPLNAGNSATRYYGTIQEGRVLVNGLPEGSYEIETFSRQGRTSAGKAQFQVPLEGPLHIEQSAGFDWSVSIRMPGDAVPQVNHLALIAREGGRIIRGEMQTLNSFVLKGVTVGVWQLQLQAGPSSYFIKSVRAGTLEFTPHRLDVFSSPGAPLQIVLSGNGPELSGRLVPESEEKATHIRMIAVEESGVIHLNPRVLSERVEWSGMPPGRYRLLAARVGDVTALANPAVLKELAAYLQPVTLEEGTKAQVELKVVPEDMLARLCVY
jgi:hypothetical protein